ncbi:hypothetical protein M409DRAFT_22422 [Zasmidium cellare ATCC 36951]|uniref:DUF7702 domain-containing protein n=1 Tax=Zasmidium cellare ATCC 36951 TaxID=1080233 RepID=A0A6A6CKP8_ZASCE|nr:uncharacterized protein M409DRAFT_22422 [Zasmidium cellare ATCC 36951]KAF2167621.1 hypothetical protein M409DRAFT_22422 [Zasmidium cellare ATCC 36951]
MTLSHDSILSIVELVLYAPLLPLTTYLLFRHGRHGILGYYYLSAACTVRAVSDIVQLATSVNDSTPSLGATILSSVGLSPLMLALAGMLHENHHYRLEMSNNTAAVKSRITKLLWFVQINIHSISNSAIKLREAGSIILLLLWIGLGQYAVYLAYRCRDLPNRNGIVSLAFWNLLDSPFIGIKVIYNVVYAFDHDDATLNPNTGSLAVKVVLVVLPSLVVAVLLTIGGWKSRDISRLRGYDAVNPGEQVSYEVKQERY